MTSPQQPAAGIDLLRGLRVVDLTTGIAGPYATKLLADAGADVVKVEPPGGDELRRWTAGSELAPDADGALFRFLHAGKRSIVADRLDDRVLELCGRAELVLEDGRLDDERLAQLRHRHPSVPVVSVTWFGRGGPWADRPASEFVLQALCGSTGGRGNPEREPLHAGGRLGEWIGGTYAAVAALAARRSARASGIGDHVDVSIFECMSITMGGYAGLNVSMGGAVPPGPARTTELPSIEPTADGYVGFCTVTGQQFQDFLVLIDHPELLGDPELASFVGRQRRRHEFLELVWAWTGARTTDEIIALASAMRIPVSPIGTPDSIPSLEQFVERKVFQWHQGEFLAPRPPYRVDGHEPSEPRPHPSLGEHQGQVRWEGAAGPTAAAAPSEASQLPLAGVRVVDLTAFWAGPAATQLLALLGAEVIKVESVQRPDGMRFSSSRAAPEPRWWEWGSIFQAVNVNKRGITLDLSSPEGRELLLDLVARSDVLIENFSPRVLDNFGLTWDVVHARNPRTIMVRMPAFGLDGPWRDRTGFAQTMEQATGMAWMTGFADGPAVIPRGPCDPNAGMHAVVALLAALEERERSGVGRHIESTMVEAALNVAAEVVIERTAYGTALKRDGNRGPVAAPQGLYACRGEERWLALAATDDVAWRALVGVLGDPEWARRPELGDAAGRRRAHDELDGHLAAWAAQQDRDEACAALLAAGVPAAPVLESSRAMDNPQHRARGFLERFDHPVVGQHEVIGVPFRFGSLPGPWLTSPAPTLGQHDDDVLGGLVGVSADRLAELRAAAVVGDRPAAR